MVPTPSIQDTNKDGAEQEWERERGKREGGKWLKDPGKRPQRTEEGHRGADVGLFSYFKKIKRARRLPTALIFYSKKGRLLGTLVLNEIGKSEDKALPSPLLGPPLTSNHPPPFISLTPFLPLTLPPSPLLFSFSPTLFAMLVWARHRMVQGHTEPYRSTTNTSSDANTVILI